MLCKHGYYQYVKGELVCSVCGKPTKDRPAIEDKIAERTEVKQIYPTEAKRLGKKRR